jgi:hypothetical protein
VAGSTSGHVSGDGEHGMGAVAWALLHGAHWHGKLECGTRQCDSLQSGFLACMRHAVRTAMQSECGRESGSGMRCVNTRTHPVGQTRLGAGRNCASGSGPSESFPISKVFFK